MEIGDVVRVKNHNEALAYYGELTALRSLRDCYLVRTPDDGELHEVLAYFVEPASEEESDAYIARWVDGEAHDEECELRRSDWPQFKEWTDPVTGRHHEAGPYPCHCEARRQGRADAERDLEAGR